MSSSARPCLSTRQLDYVRRATEPAVRELLCVSHDVGCFGCGAPGQVADGHLVPIVPYISPKDPSRGLQMDSVVTTWFCARCTDRLGL